MSVTDVISPLVQLEMGLQPLSLVLGRHVPSHFWFRFGSRKNGAQAELRKIDQLRLQVESTLRTIELQKLVEADDALVGSLDSIRISITSLVQYGDAMSDSDSSGSHSDPSDEKAFEDILNRF